MFVQFEAPDDGPHESHLAGKRVEQLLIRAGAYTVRSGLVAKGCVVSEAFDPGIGDNGPASYQGSSPSWFYELPLDELLRQGQSVLLVELTITYPIPRDENTFTDPSPHLTARRRRKPSTDNLPTRGSELVGVLEAALPRVS